MSQRKNTDLVRSTQLPARGLAPVGPPICLWNEQMTQRSGQRSRSGKCPEPVTGSRPPRSTGTSKVIHAIQSLACSMLLGGTFCLQAALGCRSLPLLPPKCLLLGQGPAGGERLSRSSQHSRCCGRRSRRTPGPGRRPRGAAQQGGRHAPDAWTAASGLVPGPP